MADIVYPTKVRVISFFDTAGWREKHAKWLKAHEGKVVSGRKIDDDDFKPAGIDLVLHEEEYEVVEGFTAEQLHEQVWLRLAPQMDGSVIYSRCTESDSVVVNAIEAFYLMLMGCNAEVALNDPKDRNSHYEGEFRLSKI